MRSRLARLAAAFVLAVSLVPAGRAAAAASQPDPKPIAQPGGCPGPDCVSLVQDMLCHENNMCKVNGWLKEVSAGPIRLDVSIRDITTVPGDVRLVSRVVVVPPESKEFAVDLVVGGGVAQEGDKAFELRVGNATTVLIITAKR